jgi:hypothetical protein
MPDGFTIAQYIELLRTWHEETDKKAKLLMNGYRVYQVLFFLQTAGQNVCNIIATFITSTMIGLAAGGETSALIILSSIATAFGIANGIFSAISFVFKPQSTATSASMSSKQYSELSRELMVEIKSYEVMFAGMSPNEVSRFSSPDIGIHRNSNPSAYELEEIQAVDLESGNIELNTGRYIDFETYKNRLLYYSTREQLISVTEPGLLLIGYTGKTVFDRTYPATIISPKDLQFLANYIDSLPQTRDRRKLKKIVGKVFIHSGITDDKK